MEFQWRDSMRPVKLAVFDARIFTCFFVWFLVPAKAVFFAVVIAVLFLIGASRKGYTPEAARRAIRCVLAGRRYACFHSRYRRRVDYGGVQ